MSDYTEQGAVPVEDAAVEHPPTVDEVLERQRKELPDQAGTRDDEGKRPGPPGPAPGTTGRPAPGTEPAS